jgi:hypothetical protein
VDYTFGQVSFVSPQVDYKGNCGNISAGVGPFAIDECLVPREHTAGPRVVRIHNTNTGAILKSTVYIGTCGSAVVDGGMAIGGVPGTGACIDLDFSETQGSVTGALLPGGARRETLEVSCESGDVEHLEVTLLDAGQPSVFVHAAALGISGGTIGARRTAELIDSDTAVLRRIERLRGAAAVRMGIVGRWEDAERFSPYTPFVMAVEAPSPGAHWDLSSTCVFMQRLHKAYPVTGSVATIAAALLPGTIPFEVCRADQKVRTGKEPLRIGHPSGIMELHGLLSDEPDTSPRLLRASIARTARRLMDGMVYIPHGVWPGAV